MKVSIVTVSLNQGAYVEQAIRSVLDQGDVSREYVVADGGSTDDSVSIIRRHEGRLTKWHSRPDGGPSQALNEAFSATSGEVLGYVNADDYLLPGALSRVVTAFAGNPSADVVYGDAILVDGSGTFKRKLYSDEWSLKRYAYGACTIIQPATFFKRSAFDSAGGFNPANRTCWDGELLVDMAGQGCHFHHIHDQLAAFRLHAGSISGSGRLRLEYERDCERLFRKIMKRDRTLVDKAVLETGLRVVMGLTRAMRRGELA